MKDAHQLIKHILLTEKGTRLTEKNNQYQFKVATDANKIEIKQAVETLFKVQVKKVTTMNCRGKMKRGRTWRAGKTADWKRAVVTLQEGDRIDLT